ncbi:MAG: LysR substrate-binding domain-containing protein [Litorimonas sp.]
MNLRDLDYICAVADLKHFGKAAERCNVSQPTLSGQIKKLETTLGVKLFERSHKGIRVTPIGATIIDVARQARDSVTRIHALAIAEQDPLAGALSLGIIPTIAPYLIPLFVGTLSQDIPKLSVAYHEDITERLTQDLLGGQLDAAILATPPEDNNLTSLPLYAEPFWVIYPDDHPMSLIKNITVKDVDMDDLLLLTEGHCFRDQALSVCGPNNAPRQQSLRATSLETLINLVASRQGLTLVPALAMRSGWFYDIGLGSQKLADKNAYRQVHITYRKQFPHITALEAIADTIKAGLPKSVNIAP